MDPVRATSPSSAPGASTGTGGVPGRDGGAAEPHAPGWQVRVVDSTGSTNADLLALAAEGAPHRTVLAARHQTAGRGRLDRTWEAPPGANLLVSLLIRDVPEHVHELTWRVGLAGCAAVAAVSGRAPVLKWPNDLLLDDRKLAGVLAQSAGIEDDRHVVVGIGLNVRWAPEGAAMLGADADPLEVLVALLRAYDELPADVWPEYRRHLHTIGRNVLVQLPGGAELRGRAVDVERDGRLVVVDERATRHRFGSGDVVHLR